MWRIWFQLLVGAHYAGQMQGEDTATRNAGSFSQGAACELIIKNLFGLPSRMLWHANQVRRRLVVNDWILLSPVYDWNKQRYITPYVYVQTVDVKFYRGRLYLVIVMYFDNQLRTG